MDGEQPIAVLEQLLTDKGEHLLRTAILLAGSQPDGEDLLQTALERVIQRWRTIRGEPEGYLRRTLYHLAVDGWRRKKAWRARLGLLAAPDVVPDGADAVDQRDRIVRLLHSLTPRQRTAIVLRYRQELSEARPNSRIVSGRRRAESGCDPVLAWCGRQQAVTRRSGNDPWARRAAGPRDLLHSVHRRCCQPGWAVLVPGVCDCPGCAGKGVSGQVVAAEGLNDDAVLVGGQRGQCVGAVPAHVLEFAVTRLRLAA